ncbi:hypothetical protein [Pseudomonas phage UF_RH7]|nr:hypothetical protein [Pseudomonas phage UF_RH7]
MASKRRLRRRTCEGKIKHETAEKAARAIISLVRSRGHQGQLHVYQCPFCMKFHVGHRRHGNGIGSGYA